jgi:hypothetical protein
MNCDIANASHLTKKSYVTSLVTHFSKKWFAVLPQGNRVRVSIVRRVT